MCAIRGTPGAISLAAALTLMLASSAVAQDMEGGEARIKTRSDVQMRLESQPGTSKSRLKAMGRVAGEQMGEIRSCYADVVSERPTVEGKLELVAELPERGRLRVEVQRDGPDDRPLTRCVRKALRRGDYGDVDRPAAAGVMLEFTNNAAEGAKRTAKRRKKEQAVSVQKNEKGIFEAQGGTPDGRVRFTVRGITKGQGKERVAGVFRGVRSAIPSLLDCRRRAGTRGRSPVGEIELAMRVSRRGRARTRARRNTVEAGRLASRCVERALVHADFQPAAAGRTALLLSFGRERSGGTEGAPAGD